MKGIIPPPFLFFTAHPTFPFSNTVEKRAQLKACNFLFKVSKTKPLQTVCTVRWVWGRSILPEIVPHPENKTRTFQRSAWHVCKDNMQTHEDFHIFPLGKLWTSGDYDLSVWVHPCTQAMLVSAADNTETTHVWKQGVHGKSACVPLIFNVT